GGPDAEGAPCRVAEDRPASALAQPHRRDLAGGGSTDGVVASGPDGGEARTAPLPHQRHEELRDGLAVGKRPGGGAAPAPCPGADRLAEQLAEQLRPPLGQCPARLGAARVGRPPPRHETGVRPVTAGPARHKSGLAVAAGPLWQSLKSSLTTDQPTDQPTDQVACRRPPVHSYTWTSRHRTTWRWPRWRATISSSTSALGRPQRSADAALAA